MLVTLQPGGRDLSRSSISPRPRREVGSGGRRRHGRGDGGRRRGHPRLPAHLLVRQPVLRAAEGAGAAGGLGFLSVGAADAAAKTTRRMIF